MNTQRDNPIYQYVNAYEDDSLTIPPLPTVDPQQAHIKALHVQPIPISISISSSQQQQHQQQHDRIKIHSFTREYGRNELNQQSIYFQLILMGITLFIWISDKHMALTNLLVTMPSISDIDNDDDHQDHVSSSSSSSSTTILTNAAVINSQTGISAVGDNEELIGSSRQISQRISRWLNVKRHAQQSDGNDDQASSREHGDMIVYASYNVTNMTDDSSSELLDTWCEKQLTSELKNFIL